MPRAWVINEYSGYEGLSLEDFDAEEPGPGEIRLKVEAFALNWGDMDLMHDRYSFSFTRFPARIGMEAAGIVDAVGADVVGIEVGDRYCTLPYFYVDRGASAESVVIDAKYVTKAPDGLTAVESASIWMQYMTAYFPIVEISGVGAGTNVLVTAATSTAGTAALEIGRSQGATMIGTTRFDYNRDYLMEAGADHVIVTGKDGSNLSDELRDATGGKGVDVIFDSVGAGLIQEYSAAMALNARIYFYGALDSKFPDLPLVPMWQSNAVFHPYSLFHYVQDSATCVKGTKYVYEALKSGGIAPRIDRVYPMEEYREAWEYLKEPRKTHGKVVIETGI